ncbi:MAG: type II toxin-antitoxin system RelE/ParE family toxin [Bryobacterales bacterium]
MTRFAVVFKGSARKELEGLPDRFLRRVFLKIEILAENPRPAGCRKLRNSSDLWRVRVGDYRVVYSINDDARTVEILRVRHRREVYD